jgi:hypothetical protein
MSIKYLQRKGIAILLINKSSVALRPAKSFLSYSFQVAQQAKDICKLSTVHYFLGE